MIIMTKPRFILTLALILLISGWIIPLLMIMHILSSTFLMNLLGWAFSVSGLFLGFIGVALLTKIREQ